MKLPPEDRSYPEGETWGWQQPDGPPGWVADGQQQASVGEQPESWNGAVTDAVRMGYQVIEEHIRQGRRTARKMQRHEYGVGSLGDDLWEALQRTVGFSEDLMSLWIGALRVLLPGAKHSSPLPWPRFSQGFGDNGAMTGNGHHSPNGRLENDPWGPSVADDRGAPAAGESLSPWSLSIDVTSSRPTRTVLDVELRNREEELIVEDLMHSSDPAVTLSEAAFYRTPEGLQLRVEVSERHPPGVYSGFVRDRWNGSTRGCLRVELEEEGLDPNDQDLNPPS